jgi:CheY-like chemotaxis protein
VVSDEIKQLTQEIPVDDYLTKPYSKPELLEAIEDITD